MASPVVHSCRAFGVTRSHGRRNVGRLKRISAFPVPKFVSTGVVELPADALAPTLEASSGLSFGVAAAQGPRSTMEDEAVVFPEGKCGFLYASTLVYPTPVDLSPALVVLDGHDGLESVQWLSAHMFEIFSDVLDESLFDGACAVDFEDKDSGLCCPVELSPSLTESFHAADQQLLSELRGQEGSKAKKSGSTATVALVRENKIIVANVGDSRGVLCRNGRAIDLTTEHRVMGKGAAVASEIARVEASGGWIDDGRVCGLLAVSRAFGDCDLKNEGLDDFLQESLRDGFLTEEFVSQVHFMSDPLVCTPDVTELDLTNDDQFVIVATDGLWDVMSSSDAVRFVSRQFKRGCSAAEATEKLVDLAIKRYTADNVAAVVIDLQQPSMSLKGSTSTSSWQ